MIDDSFEQELWKNNKLLLGCDECSTGSAAGSAFIAGVIFPINAKISGLGINDSKKLPEAKRLNLEVKIKELAARWFVLPVSNEEIETGNIQKLCLNKARDHIIGLDMDPRDIVVFIDGNKRLPLPPWFDTQCLVKGDSKIISIAAASILAKCAKTREMIELDARYPEYGFAKNAGYLTKDHQSAIKKYGLTPVHRKRYCSKLIGK